MNTTTRIDRSERPASKTPVQLPCVDGPVASTPTLPMLQDAWSRAIARVLARRR